MELKERLVLCRQCTKRTSDLNIGMICSITNMKPEFEGTCENFEIDAKEAQRQYVKTENHEEKSNKAAIWVVLGVVLIVIRIVLRLAQN